MVFCTEPFRISFAGKVDVVCFDKTGTLTKDEMILKGVASSKEIDVLSPSSSSLETDEELDQDLLEPFSASDLVKCIMGTCHDLVHQRGRPGQNAEKDTVLGDPLDLAAFDASGFKFLVMANSSERHRNYSPYGLFNSELEIKGVIRQRYPFTSDLKRMTTIATLTGVDGVSSSGSNQGQPAEATYAFCKGAPEVLQEYLRAVPQSYAETYSSFMKSGKRVLALAYKPLPTSQVSNAHKMSRKDAESNLVFAGFLVFDCDMKADSKGVIKELHYSGHRTVMITGDAVYTAVNVAKRLTMIDNQRPVLVLVAVQDTLTQGSDSKRSTDSAFSAAECAEDTNNPLQDSLRQQRIVWRALDGAIDLTASHSVESDIPFHFHVLRDDPQFVSNNILCVTGKALEVMIAQHPRDYAEAIKALVPHVSLFARVSPQQKERVVLSLNESGCTTLMCGDGTNDVGALKAAHVGVSIINNPRLESHVEQLAAATGESNGSGKKKSKSSSRDRMNRAMLEMKAHQEDPSLVKLGDASIASPFTSKRTSVDCVLSIIRQGRCTLVTTIQVYKVLALNCLASAYMMSSLYLKGLKQGDTQMTCSGLVVATLFFFLSQAKPLLDISDVRPPSSVFSPAVTASILGQFITHLISMWITMRLCEEFAIADGNDSTVLPDGKFSPNLVNTAMFILSTQMQINNFWVNYRGPPFMQALSQNVYFWYLLQAVYLVILIVVGGQFEPMNDLLQLVALPCRDFQVYFLAILAGNAAVAYLVEMGCRRLE